MSRSALTNYLKPRNGDLMRKIIIPAAALALVVSTAAFAGPAPTPQDQVTQRAQAAVNALGALVTQATDNRQALAAIATVLKAADQSAPQAEALKASLQAWIAAANQAAQAQVDAADKKADDAHKDAVISQRDRDNARKLLDADQKTIADLRKQVADKTQALAQGAKMCLRPTDGGNPVHGLPHSVPAR